MSGAKLEQKPSIGRIVHYHDEGGPYAGIITAVHDEENGRVDLVTFGPHSIYHHNEVLWSPSPFGKSWTWPPRV